MMMKFWNRKNGKKGFTLVELIVVIAILVILAAILIPVVSGYMKDAEQTAAYANARTVYTAAMSYFAAKNTTPVVLDSSTPADAALLAPYLGASFGHWKVYVTNGAVTKIFWAENTTAQGMVYAPGVAMGVLQDKPAS